MKRVILEVLTAKLLLKKYFFDFCESCLNDHNSNIFQKDVKGSYSKTKLILIKLIKKKKKKKPNLDSSLSLQEKIEKSDDTRF